MNDKDYPAWVCVRCGNKYGRRSAGVCTYHLDTCGVCGEKWTMVTEPRDFGHLRDNWKNETRHN